MSSIAESIDSRGKGRQALHSLIPGFDDEMHDLREIAPSGFILAFNVTFRGPQYLYSEYPVEWQTTYDENNFYMADPIFYWINISSKGATRWSEVRGPDPLKIRPKARAHGLVFGAAFTKKIAQKRAFLTAARADREFTDTEMGRLGAKFDFLAQMVVGAATLTAAELEALRLLCDGLDQQEIAERLGVSRSAVKQRMQSACSKLGAKTTAHAVALCISRNLLES
jgi:LuxR family transcriptional regulator